MGAGRLRVVRRLRHAAPEMREGHWGLVLGIVALGIHAVVDFNHQIPANALLFVLICALALPVAKPEDAR